MRIGFDLRPSFKRSSRRRGIGKTARLQMQHLLSLENPHEYVLLAKPGAAVDLPGRFETLPGPWVERPGRLAWLADRLLLGSRLKKAKLDLFHAMEITSIPILPKTPVWATVYDLIPLVFWEETRRSFPWDYLQALKLGFRRIETADRIVTCSQHSKKDICQRLEVDESRVEVVYLAAADTFKPVNRERAQTRLAEKHSISGPFLFYVGGSDFRKNLLRLLRAFSEVRRSGYPGKLALAGETFLWDLPETRIIRNEIERLRLGPSISFPGYVPDEELPDFYSACDCFVFPSLYEGFGLPVLEAMQCGAPVVASRVSAIPEVAGEAARYFDPEDESGMASAIAETCQRPQIADTLRTAGFQQAARFSWFETARQLHDLYANG